MRVCKQCSSSDVAQAVWLHLNTVGLMPIENKNFYWCFNCKKETEIADTGTVFNVPVPVEPPKEQKIIAVNAHLRVAATSTLAHHYNVEEFSRKGSFVRYWHLIKNAKRKEAKGYKVEWGQVKGNYVPVWIELKPQKIKIKK